MTNYKFGEVLLVPFPFTNQNTNKKRPAVVISSSVYQKNKSDLIIMAVTSQVRPTQAFGEIQLKDWKGAGLLKPSTIKPVITTLEQSLVIKPLGKLQPDDLASLRKLLNLLLK